MRWILYILLSSTVPIVILVPWCGFTSKEPYRNIVLDDKTDPNPPKSPPKTDNASTHSNDDPPHGIYYPNDADTKQASDDFPINGDDALVIRNSEPAHSDPPAAAAEQTDSDTTSDDYVPAN